MRKPRYNKRRLKALLRRCYDLASPGTYRKITADGELAWVDSEWLPVEDFYYRQVSA